MAIGTYTPGIDTLSGPNHTRARLGPASALHRYELAIPARNLTLRGKIFLRDLLHLTGMEVSVTRLAPGESVPYLHSHRTHEELYVITRGRGQMQVDGELFDVEEGAVIRVATGGSRALRAAADQELHFVCVQARQDSMPEAEVRRDGIPAQGGLRWPA